MNGSKQHLLNGLMILFAVLHSVTCFVPSALLTALSAAVLLVIAAFTVPTLNRTARLVFFALALAGSALLIAARADALTWVSALLKNGDLLLLLICVPMISGPFYYEDYQSELKHLAQLKMRNLMSFLILVTVCSHVFAVIISVGAIIIVYELLSPFGKLYNADRRFLETLHRSYCSSGFWSPAWASVIVYTAFPDVLWLKVIPLGLAFGALFNAISLLGIFVESKRHPDRYPDIEPDPTVTLDKRKLYIMLLLVAAMILSIVLVNSTTGWNLMLSVSAVSLVFPIVAALIQRKLPAWRRELKTYYNVQLPKVKSQLAVFMMAGFLGKALSVSGVGDLLVSLLPDWMIAYPPLMICCIMLLLTLPVAVGVHPAATGTALVAAIAPAAIGLSNYTFALAILTGWVLATMMGPFSAVALVMTSYTGRNNYSVSIGANWKFCLICLVVFSLLISWIGPIMG